MIDFNKISKLKSLKEIKKYNIDKPVFLNNYLFHYFIMTNNIKGMEVANHPIYIENDEGLQGFHLAAKVAAESKSFNMLNMLIKKYPDYATNLNIYNESFLNYLDVNDKLINLIKKNKNINWIKLLNNQVEIDEMSTSNLNRIFSAGSYKLIKFIKEFLNSNKINWKELPTTPIFELPINKNLNSKQLINLIKLIGINIINDTLDKSGRSFIYGVILSGKKDVLEFLIENNFELDKYTPYYTWHPFINCYNFEIKNKNGKNKFEMSKLIWKQIKKYHNFSSTNKNGENLAFSILNSRLISGSGDYELEMDILKRNTEWNKFSVDKVTILHVLVNLSFDKYSKFLKNIKVNKKQKDNKNKTILHYASGRWLKLLKSLESTNENCNKKNNDCTKINDYKLSNSNTFSSTISDAGLFFIHLDRKYKNLYIPKYLNKTEENLNWENGMNFPDNFINSYNNFPWVIYWQDRYNYYIHPNLNLLINANKNKDEYDYAAVLLSVRLPFGGLHAMMIYYDFKNNFVERFDPYGNTHDIDIHIDEILEEELTWNTGFYYLNVKKYLPVAGFQNLSDETNLLNQKPGDFGGYCLAWCLWYLEHRILNYKFTAKKLIEKSMKKLLERENSLIEFIRNYANELDKNRLKMLEKIGIPKNRVSNSQFNLNEDKKVFEYVIKHTTIN